MSVTVMSAPPKPTLRETLGSLGGYALLSVLLFGLPVIGHLDSKAVASNDVDPSAYMWFFAWWPHAILHGLNPFITHAMFVPTGYNLTWVAAMPGPSILLAPITLAFGPAVTWNVIELAAPALSAWTAFLLCRHITGRLWPSLAGGYLFGFSPYMLSHLTGSPNLALVALLPVFVLLVLRRLDGTLGRREFVIAMLVALVAQFSISTEVLASATLVGAIALVLAFALYWERRRELLDVVRLLGIAYAGSAIVLSPFLYFFFAGPHYPPWETSVSADLVSFVLPPSLVELTRHGAAFYGSSTEGYLGLPLIVLVLAFVWQQRRSRRAQFLGLSALIAALLSLGRHLLVRGTVTSLPGPGAPLLDLPLLHYALPSRFAVFVMLPIAVVFALWLCGPLHRDLRGAVHVGLAALVIVSIFRTLSNSAWETPVRDPTFFAGGEYRQYLKPADHVLTVPSMGRNERWQADTGFYFKLAGGYAGQAFPSSYTRYPTWGTLRTGQLTRDYGAQLRIFVRAKGVTAIVVDETVPGPWLKLFGTLGVRPVSAGGVLFYRLRAPA